MKEAERKNSHIACFHLNEASRIGKSIETESRLVVARGSGAVEIGSDYLLTNRSPFGVKKMLWN